MGFEGGPERRELVAAICREALGAEAEAIEPILGDGIVNAVFRVDAAGRELVFRIQLDQPEDGVFRKERWCMERAQAAGVPGAEAVALGTFGQHAYAIHTRVPGVVGLRSGGDPDVVWREIGRHARRFHQVRAEGFGEHVGGPVGEAPDTSLAGWVAWWDEYAFGSGALVAVRGVLTAAELRRARALVAGVRDWPGEPRLCHGNLSLANVLVDGADVYVIDWGTAAGHLAPLFDLAELCAWSLEPEPPGLRAFCDGYGLAGGTLAAMASQSDVLQLWRVVTSAHWMLETGRQRSDSLDFLTAKARQLLGRL